MRALAIDLGLKRTGFAISDETGLSIRLLPVFEAKNQNELLEFIFSIVKEFSIKNIVLGMPKYTDQSKALIIRINSLKKKLQENGLKVYLMDEVLSSKKAMQNLIKSGINQKKRQKLLDSESAAVILEEFLYYK